METINSIPKFSDISDDVKKLQTKLLAAGFDPQGADGKFGHNTKNAVIAFQVSKGLLGLGVVGLKTLAFLNLKITDSRYPYELLFLEFIAVDKKLTDAESNAFYAAIKQICDDKIAFQAAIKEGINEIPVDWSPCASTTSAVLEAAFRRGNLDNLAQIFNNHQNYGPTHEVEKMLFRLGFKYWLKKDYISQKGAIGLMEGRTIWHGTQKHSNHIYTIFKESDKKYDLIGDNGGYNHIYRETYEGVTRNVTTEGFWLPHTIIPTRRTV